MQYLPTAISASDRPIEHHMVPTWTGSQGWARPDEGSWSIYAICDAQWGRGAADCNANEKINSDFEWKVHGERF